jgi:hypothetical protein
MKTVIAILAFFISVVSFAQDQYAKGMRKAFELWGSGKTTEASNMFERISNAEIDNWLPYYYVAQINTIVSFGEKDKEKLTQQLEKAKEFIDFANAISPKNPEIMVQQAMRHTAWVAFDGATYGMTLSGKVAALYAKAAQIAPDNPRVIFSKAQWDMGSATYFGKDTSLYCIDVERSLELFANFKPESDFHPRWGKDQARQTLENCGKQ